MPFKKHVPAQDDGSPLFGRCVRCISFQQSRRRGCGICSGNTRAFKEVTGQSFRAGAPEGPSFEVRKLDTCSFWEPAWSPPSTAEREGGTAASQMIPWGEMQRRFVGRKFRRRMGGTTETRKVVDCTLGGGIVYRHRLGGYWHEVTESEQGKWLSWVKSATEVVSR